MTDTDALLSPTMAAQRLGLSAKTLKRWANDGRIAYIRLPNGYIKFRPSDIDDARTVTLTVAAIALDDDPNREGARRKRAPRIIEHTTCPGMSFEADATDDDPDRDKEKEEDR